MHDGYFEAIIQLRNPNKEAQVFLEKAIGDNLTKIKKVRNGFDFFIKSNKRGQQIGREMQKKFGSEYNAAPKLFSRDNQTGKELHRLSILVKLPGFAKKDVLKIKGELIKITGFAKKVTGVNIKTGKKITMNHPDKFEIIEKYETRVVKIKPKIEVLHPKTYQPEVLQNPKPLQMDEKVKVIIENGLWAI